MDSNYEQILHSRHKHSKKLRKNRQQQKQKQDAAFVPICFEVET